MSASVVVVGSCMMDLTLRAPRRPGPGETVVGTAFEEHLGGKGCNQAVAAARAGAATAMVARVGADPYGARFLDLLAREGIDGAHVSVDDLVGTGIGVPLVEDNGENSIVIVPRANDELRERDVRDAATTIAGADVLLLQLEVPMPVVLEAARVAKEAGARVVLNPAPAPASPAVVDGLRGLVDVVVPNEVELAQLAGSAADPATAAARLGHRLGAVVIVTLGAEGSLVVDGDRVDVVPAHPVEVVDTVGAGDAYCGYLAARLALGDDLVSAARWASAAASLAVTRQGAEPCLPHLAQVQALLGDPTEPAVTPS